MLKTVLWIAAACAAILVALAVSRTMNFDKPVKAPEEKAAVVEQAPAPVEAAPAEAAPPPEVKAAPPPLTPEEQQIQDDAAATGMTTVEPEAPSDPPTN